MDYLIGPSRVPAARPSANRPQALADLVTNATALADKAGANAGDAELADRLEALKAELADLSASWPDPSGKYTPSTTIHVSDDPSAWRQEDPSFGIFASVPGHLGGGKHTITVNGKPVAIEIKSTRRQTGSPRIDAYATILTKKAA